MKITKTMLKEALYDVTYCDIQHTGWPCGTCFFYISKEFTNEDWQALLLFRGDYKREELDNLPKNVSASIKKIYDICIKMEQED